jgi:hypothetical protein
MKSKSLRYIRTIAVIYAAIYLIGIVSSFYNGELSFHKFKDTLFFVLFIIFLSGIALLWTKERISGIIFMVWNAFIWIYDLQLAREDDSGMISIMTIPVMVIGALLYLEWYKNSRNKQQSVPYQWKFILRVLLINYAVLYTIVVISELFSEKTYDYFSLPFILFPLMLLVFLIGFVFSWEYELQAGFIFLLWYAILLTGSVIYFEFRDSGPWIRFEMNLLQAGSFWVDDFKIERMSPNNL